MISYAQNFEDVMLERLLSDQVAGFYVDVGAWDPHLMSVTKHFYLKGWHGINIEPIRSRVLRFESERPRDINLNVAIASKKGEVTFWECREDDSLSTTEMDEAEALRGRGLSLVETKVRARHLDEIFAEHGLTDIDFLKIDVEGAEADAIRTAEFKSCRPRVLVIEATKPGLRPDWSHPESIGTWEVWEPYILKRGYVFGHFDGLNRFYVRAEDRILARRLHLPPGIFDNIENLGLGISAETELLGRLENSDADRAERLRVIERLDAQNEELRAGLETSEADRAARLEVIERLDAQVQELNRRLDTSEADRAARLEVIERLDAQVQELRQMLEASEGRCAQQQAATDRLNTEAQELRTALEMVKEELGWVNTSPDAVRLGLQYLNSVQGALRHSRKRIIVKIATLRRNLIGTMYE